MIQPFALQIAPAHPDYARWQALEAELVRREAGLAAVKVELQALQAQYLDKVGSLYAELSALDAAVAEEEVRQGLRQPPLFVDGDDGPDDTGAEAAGEAPDSTSGGGCSNRSAPSDVLKRVFRDLAKAVHPDLATDDRARYRRHSLMAEANRAYAERDEDRLRLILRTWERSPEAVLGDDSEADGRRVQRRTAEINERLLAIDTELADLQSSAIARLKIKIDEARARNWDLLAEMALQVRREVGRASARLVSLRAVR
jgi:hypothetical protein